MFGVDLASELGLVSVEVPELLPPGCHAKSQMLLQGHGSSLVLELNNQSCQLSIILVPVFLCESVDPIIETGDRVFPDGNTKAVESVYAGFDGFQCLRGCTLEPRGAGDISIRRCIMVRRGDF